MTLKLGDTGDTVRRWREVMSAMFGGTAAHPGLYARLHGHLAPGDVFGQRAQDWQKEYQFRTGQASSFEAASGVVSDADLHALKVTREHRPIWCYSAPGSGAPWWLGPPFDLGEWCKQVLNLNHQPIGYPIGGYMGLMGGDPGTSYIDVVNSLTAELDRLLSINPDRDDPALEIWLYGYSQSADAIKQAAKILFGDNGKYAALRPRINGLILFGDPARRPGPTKVGTNPPGRGIAQKITYPAWLEALVWDIVNQSPTPDFYAAVTDHIRPLFYDWFIRAETSLSFVIYSAQIVIPALLNLLAPGMGDLESMLTIPILASASGIPGDQLAPVVGGVLGSSEAPDPELIKFLSIQGILTSLPDLLSLLMALPGLQVHGDYYAPKDEFGGRSGLQVGCDIVAGFRR
jgi:hypothetical protein